MTTVPWRRPPPAPGGFPSPPHAAVFLLLFLNQDRISEMEGRSPPRGSRLMGPPVVAGPDLSSAEQGGGRVGPSCEPTADGNTQRGAGHGLGPGQA